MTLLRSHARRRGTRVAWELAALRSFPLSPSSLSRSLSRSMVLHDGIGSIEEGLFVVSCIVIGAAIFYYLKQDEAAKLAAHRAKKQQEGKQG